MKIHDIINEIRWTKTNEPYSSMVSRMSNVDKYEFVGSGEYGHVFQHPKLDRTVIKLFANDRGYAEYLRWMAQHQNNRYVPKIIPYEDGSIIKPFKQLTKTAEGHLSSRIGIIQLRKLEPISQAQLLEFKNYLFKFLSHDSNMRKSVRSHFLFDIRESDLLQIQQNSKSTDSDLSELFTELLRMYRRWGGLDIHNQNLMWDPETNHVIFTDVLSVQK